MNEIDLLPDKRLAPLLKYPGGKEGELKHILSYLPKKIDRYFEPFIGGGAVFFSITADCYYINDKSTDLMRLYNCIKNQDSVFFDKLEFINRNWKTISNVIDSHGNDLLEMYLCYRYGNINNDELLKKIADFVTLHADEFNGLFQDELNYSIGNFVLELIRSIKSKMTRMKKIEEKKSELIHDDIISNIEGAMKSAFYFQLRHLLNNGAALSLDEATLSAIYLFIRQTCYSSMFRYNKDGKFNVPYGGISYNRNNFDKKIEYFKSDDLIKHLGKTSIANLDFYDFMGKHTLQSNDFVFVDPPYDSDFSTYDKNVFGNADQIRLANYLINECSASFMLVIKNTEFISSLYHSGVETANGGCLHINSFDKQYFVSFMDRNEKSAKHLLITNYSIDWKECSNYAVHRSRNQTVYKSIGRRARGFEHNRVD